MSLTREYIVNKILDKKIMKGRAYYLINWEGFSEKDNTWEPAVGFATNIVAMDYEAKIKSQLPKQKQKDKIENSAEPAPKRLFHISKEEKYEEPPNSIKKIYGKVCIKDHIIFIVDYHEESSGKYTLKGITSKEAIKGCKDLLVDYLKNEE
jgi:Chromo (CHRromatin Organisation MOdifier) domain